MALMPWRRWARGLAALAGRRSGLPRAEAVFSIEGHDL